jgi:hypothetical protein
MKGSSTGAAMIFEERAGDVGSTVVMTLTSNEMNSKYKATSESGLASSWCLLASRPGVNDKDAA